MRKQSEEHMNPYEPFSPLIIREALLKSTLKYVGALIVSGTTTTTTKYIICHFAMHLTYGHPWKTTQNCCKYSSNVLCKDKSYN